MDRLQIGESHRPAGFAHKPPLARRYTGIAAALMALAGLALTVFWLSPPLSAASVPDASSRGNASSSGGATIVCGDVDGNGKVNVLDAVIGLQIVVKLVEPTSIQLALSDVVVDRQVDVFDAVLMLQHIVGKSEITRCSLEPLQDMSVERAFPALTFDELTNLSHPDDEHDLMFVTEQEGRILVFPNDQQAAPADVSEFMDITDRVNRGGSEEGLLGLVFDPDYQRNGYFYVYYSALAPVCSTDSRCSVLSRFSVSEDSPESADPQSELVILEVGQPATNHNAGQLAFGPEDGYLYVALGDGGSGGAHNAQDKSTLLGSILRIDVRDISAEEPYRVPPDNPFVDDVDARHEIWAYGFRNPWRFSFDAETALMWVADVGQNDWEEIDLVEKGRNYGWNIMEGPDCFSPSTGCDQTGLELPLASYSHSEDPSHCAVTGGYVYRRLDQPSLLGAYVYGDYCSGHIWAVRYDGQSVTEERLLAESDLLIPSFGRDREGNLYILSRSAGIYRLTPAE